MINLVVIEGRLTADPEERRTQNGTLTVSGRLACQRSRKNRDGNYETDFFNYVIFGDGGMYFKKAFRKGNKAVVHGELQTRSYKDKDGNAKWYVEIVVNSWSFPETKKEDQIRNNAEMDDQYQAQFKELPDEGDLPF